jgi:hypothetical protein
MAGHHEKELELRLPKEPMLMLQKSNDFECEVEDVEETPHT